MIVVFTAVFSAVYMYSIYVLVIHVRNSVLSYIRTLKLAACTIIIDCHQTMIICKLNFAQPTGITGQTMANMLH